MSPRWEQFPGAPMVVPRAATVVLLGDSITVQNNVGVWGTSTSAQGFMTWGNIFSHHRLEVIYNAGVGGERTDQMLARVAADVVARSPGYCTVMGGTNDVGQGVAHAVIVGYLEDIYDALLAADITPILCTITPVATYTAGMKVIRESVNDWIRAYNAAHPTTTLLADFGDVYADVNGDPIATMTSDGTHPSPRGASRMGEVMAATLRAGLSNAADSRHQLPNTAGEPNIVTLNPLLLGSSAGKASNWTFQANAAPMTFAYSKVARTDGKPGEWQQIVATNPDHTLWEVYQQNTAVGVDWAIGDTVWAALEFQYDAGATLAGDSFYGSIRFYNGVGAIADNFASSSYVDSDYLPPGPISGVFLTPKALIPATTTRLQAFFGGHFAGTIRLGRWAIFRTRA